MAKKKTEETSLRTDADIWLEKIARAKKVREDWHNLFRIPTCYQMWEGRQRPTWVPDSEWITINMIYSNLKAELPTLYSTDPFFYVKAKRSFSVNPMAIPEFERKAKLRQAMLNYLKGELELKPKGRLSIFDAFFQYGVVKIHLEADLEENPDKGTPILHEETGLPMLDDTGNLLTEPDFIPANEMYKITRIHPFDFLVDEDAGPLNDDVKWKAQLVRRKLEDVQKDKKYEKAARNSIQPTEMSDQAQKDREKRKKGAVYESEGKAEPDTVIIWEVYDLENEKWLVVSEGCHEFLIKPGPLPDGIVGDPFVDLRFTLRDDSWYPLPPVSQWIDPQREYCEIRSKVLVHRKRFNRKYSAYLPAFDDQDLALSKLEVGDDGTVIGQNQPMQAIFPIQDAPLDTNHMTEINYIRQDFMDLAVGPNQRGATAGIGSATEAGILESRARIREGDQQAMVIDFFVEIGKKLDKLVQANITQDQAIRVAGAAGDAWELVEASAYQEVMGEYEVQVDVGSVKPKVPEIERAQLMQLATVLSNPVAFQLLGSSPGLMRKIGEIFELDDVIVQEIIQTAAKVSQGQMPGLQQSGAQGSMPGIPENNPIAQLIGAARGTANFRGGQ